MPHPLVYAVRPELGKLRCQWLSALPVVVCCRTKERCMSSYACFGLGVHGKGNDVCLSPSAFRSELATDVSEA